MLARFVATICLSELLLGFLAGSRSRTIALRHALGTVFLVNGGGVVLRGFLLDLLAFSQRARDSRANGGEERTRCWRRWNLTGQDPFVGFFARQSIDRLGGIIVLAHH